MERDMRLLHPECRAKLKAFKQHGIPLDAEMDFEDIIELNYLCWELEKTAEDVKKDQRILLERPVRISDDVILYPWTIGSAIWLQDVVGPMFEDDEFMMGLCVAFALAHSHDKFSFEAFEDKKDITKKVRKWAKKIKVSQDKIEKAIRDILPQQDPDYIDIHEILETERKEDDQSYIPLISRLIMEYGKDAEYWIWEVAGDVCITQLDAWSKWKEEEAKAELSSQKSIEEQEEEAKKLSLEAKMKNIVKKVRLLEAKMIMRSQKMDKVSIKQ